MFLIKYILFSSKYLPIIHKRLPRPHPEVFECRNLSFPGHFLIGINGVNGSVLDLIGVGAVTLVGKEKERPTGRTVPNSLNLSPHPW